MQMGGQQGVKNQMNDNDVEMARYMHPNRGQHPVYGIGTGKFYGHRAGGGIEKFLVHRADIAAQPQYYHIVQPIPTAPRQPVQMPPPPAPVELKPVPPPEPVVLEPEIVTRVEEPSALPVAVKEVEPHPIPAELTEPKTPIEKATDRASFDLQLLPGINPRIATNLAQAGFTTPDAILKGGIEGLTAVKWVGKQRAELIMAHVIEKYGPG
jgi:hypothetical protein